MTLTLTYQEYSQPVRPAANISDPFVFFLFSYSTESKAGPKDLKRRMENDHHRAFFFFFTQALFEQSDNGSSAIFTTFTRFQYPSRADREAVVYYELDGRGCCVDLVRTGNITFSDTL